MELEGMRLLSISDNEAQTAKFDLTVAITDEGRDLIGAVEYSRDLFEEETIERLVSHYTNVLRGVAGDRERPISELDLLDEAERKQILGDWNNTGKPYPQDSRIHELFERQTESAPEAIALVYEDQQLAYAALNERANQLALYLRQLGVGPETLAGVCMERSLEMVTALLAILKAGGAYLPLDPAYPIERLRYLLEASRPVVVLTHSQVQAPIRSVSAGIDAPVVDLEADDRLWTDKHVADASQASASATQEHLAYVIYTSGSTGRPKGTMNEHRGVANRLLWMQDAYGLKRHDVVLQKTPFSFDVSVWEFFWPLLNGARLVMARAVGHKDPAYLADVIRRQQVTILHFVPSMLQVFLEYGEAPACSSLSHVICSGEALPGSLVRRFRERLGHASLHNLYGPTEAAVDVTAWACVDDVRQDAIPIGRPIANTQIYLLDNCGQPVPVGVRGEVYIGGVQVGRGYLNQPELTAERFVPCPFVDRQGARMYKTGDLGRHLPDGEIEYLGRNDFQVKVRGFRIELSEIESQLAGHPSIREAVVVAREDSPGDTRLLAYYTVATGEATEIAIDAEALRAHLSAALPEYMVPAAYIMLEAMPITPNGKLDRRALPAPESADYDTREYEAPRGEIETRLARMWAEEFRMERVGRHDHFFKLGGHSLLAVRLIERMRREGLHADVRTLFTAPTLSAFAAAVGGDDGAVDIPPPRILPVCDAITPEMLPLMQLRTDEIGRIVSAVPGGAANIQDIYPLAPLQEGILFHHLMTTEGDVYLMRTLLGFDSRVRVEGFLRALQTVIDRHDILRTSVLWEDLPEPVQVVYHLTALPVDEVNIDPETGDIAEQLYARFDPRHYRIDVRRAPLIRVYIAPDAPNDRWVMLLLFHHLSADHTTMEAVTQEIRAHLLGQSERLPAPLPFRNFIAQARLRASAEGQKAFFQAMLSDVDEPTAPFGLTDVQGDGSDVREFQHEVDAPLASRLRRVARSLGVSAASLYHLAWAQVVARVSGRDDVVFGTVLFGRMQGGDGADRVLGMFINTLPIRIRVRGDSVRDSVVAVHQLLAQLLRHEHAPLALAQRCSAVAAPSPLFSTLLNYRHGVAADTTADNAEGTLTALEGIEYLRGEERTNYPLILNVDDQSEGFTLNAQARSPIDPERVCAYMRTALERLVAALEQAPTTPIRGLDVLPASELHRLLVEWNVTQAEYPRDRCVHELFEAQVESSRWATAVVSEEERVSYEELNRRANQVARYLVRQGVGAEDRVGICVERSIDLVVGLLGILKAGGAYVPLDPNYPRERLDYMLKDAAVKTIVTQERLKAVFAERGRERICIDSDWSWIAWESGQNPERRALVENLAYVIYTSGSTGKPKGVAITHRSAVTLVRWAGEVFSEEELNGVLASTSICFDLSVFELMAPLCWGGKVVLAEDALSWPELSVASEVRLINTVPSAMRELVRRSGMPESVGTVNLAGEVLRNDLAQRIYERVSAGRVLNLYGPTEDTTYSTWTVVSNGAKEEPTIGRPIANTEVYILDQEMRPAPIGVEGEIYISGDGLARCYLNRPEMTAEKFLPNPFGKGSGERLYCTGDVGRRVEDGNVEFQGRSDRQVKVRGYRIELGEIERALEQDERVREAVVVVREDDHGDKRLVAYVVADGEREEETGRLRKYLKERLPDYMAPSAIIFLEKMPLTPNGKVDRKALPRPGREWGESEAAYVAPRTPVEEMLAGIFEDVLKLDRVGIRDNFFEIGGHSLLATRVTSRVRNALEVEIGVRSVFEEATVEGLARRIENAIRAGEKAPPPLVRAPRNGRVAVRLPLSFAQQRLWFLDQLEPGRAIYNLSVAVNLEGNLNLGALERAVNGVVRRHEVLRTRIEVEAGEPAQVVDEWAPQKLEVIDLTRLTPEEGEAEARRIAREDAGTGFDLGRGPLMRVKALKLEEGRHALLFTLHHIVSDGWSMELLVKEVCELYEVMSEGKESHLPELKFQYSDYAYWQRHYLSDEVFEESLRYWRKQLGGRPPVIDLARDRPRPPALSYRGAARSVRLSKELCESLKALSKREGVTLFMTLLAAFKTLLYKYTAELDLVIGIALANRNRSEVEPIIGFFVNMLPLRTDLSGNPRFIQLLKRVKEVALGAYAHQELPFEKLVEAIRPERELGQSPLFNIAFGVQSSPEEEVQLKGLKILPMTIAPESARLDLTLWITERAGAMSANWTYSIDLFEEKAILRLHRHFETLLSNIVARPDAPLDELEMLSEAERLGRAIDSVVREERNYSRFKSVKPRAVALTED
jgi:amino acid adenylation domain-containing protein